MKEVRVLCAGRRGGFAPVSPGGFIEPHTQRGTVFPPRCYTPCTKTLQIPWQSVPSLPSPTRRCRRLFANCNAVIATFFILNLPSRAHFRCKGRPSARSSLARGLNLHPLWRNERIIDLYFKIHCAAYAQVSFTGACIYSPKTKNAVRLLSRTFEGERYFVATCVAFRYSFVSKF